MKVITAPEELGFSYFGFYSSITCFLAGGISGCSDWQSEVIRNLQEFGKLEHLVIFNPRRENFPIDDPDAADEQIEWEFSHLNDCNIFSIYFDGGDSVQPICMYELGRYLTKCINEHNQLPTIPIISVHPEYKRAKDVFTQVRLATCNIPEDLVQYAAPRDHALRILKAYNALNDLGNMMV